MVSGKPFPNIVWRRDGRQIHEGRKYKIQTRSDGTTTLVINKVEAEDDGEYTIEAVNEAGKDKKSASLNVNGKLGQKITLIFSLHTQCLIRQPYLTGPLKRRWLVWDRYKRQRRISYCV